MERTPTSHHWGEWVLSRSRYVGYRLQQDLARQVGCTEEQISRWVNMIVPPNQMRKGFDRKLACALKTSPDMLFNQWENTPPEKAREIISKWSTPLEDDFFERATDRQLLEEFLEGNVLPNISDRQFEELIGIALVMVETNLREFGGNLVQGFKHPAIERFIRFWSVASEPGESWQQTTEKDRRERQPTREEFQKQLDEMRRRRAEVSEAPPSSPTLSPPTKPKRPKKK